MSGALRMKIRFLLMRLVFFTFFSLAHLEKPEKLREKNRSRLAAADPRTLRASACTLCDLTGVAARAVEAFGSSGK